MGSLARHRVLALAGVIAFVVLVVHPVAALGFSGFGATSADSTYGAQMRFTVQLPGGAPEKLEVLLRFIGSDGTFVAPVQPGASSAEYVWDAAAQPVTPNTKIAYRWRATDGGTVTLSPEKTLVYDDDRPGLDWQAARIGDTTVHWYGGKESEARHFGQVSANAAAAAEKLLGHKLAGPIDIFVYVSRDEFFGALGPGAREWTGAATFPELRTIFMWLGGGSASYLERTMTHEVTHVVFHDATANPYHVPATWFNEGLAVWSEQHSAADQEGQVRSAAGSGRLLAFDGITDSFPIDDVGARLAYGEGATMVAMIIDTYGRGAIAAIAAAWRDGAGDDAALQAGTGIPAAQLYDKYFASFGASAPTAVSPAPIPDSNVALPPQPKGSGNEVPGPTGSPAASPAPQPGAGVDDLALLVAIVVAGLFVGIAVAVVMARRSQPPPTG